MVVQGQTLAFMARARGFDINSLGRRADVPAGDLQEAVDGNGELDASQVEAVAQALAVPVPALFMDQQPPLLEAIDFRKATPSESRYKQGTLNAFAYIERLSATLADVGADLSVPDNARADVGDLSLAVATRLATTWRANWGLTVEEQLEFQDANRLYVSLRGFIESLGVLVLHHQFGSDDVAGLYTKIEDGPHVIAINTTGSSKARKCFTLAHEFCHFLIRQEGVSNPSLNRNGIERFCNRFAARLLAPAALVRRAVEDYHRAVSAGNDYIRLLARRLSISQEATIRRLVELDFLTGVDYRTWRAQWLGRVPAGDATDGGGGPSDPLQAKRTKYGSRLLELLGTAVREDALDEIEVFRLCGLKPRYQRQLFAA